MTFKLDYEEAAFRAGRGLKGFLTAARSAIFDGISISAKGIEEQEENRLAFERQLSGLVASYRAGDLDKSEFLERVKKLMWLYHTRAYNHGL